MKKICLYYFFGLTLLLYIKISQMSYRPASGEFPGHSFGKLSSVEFTEMGNMLESTLPSPVPTTTTKCKIHDIKLMFEKIFHIVLLFVFLKT